MAIAWLDSLARWKLGVIFFCFLGLAGVAPCVKVYGQGETSGDEERSLWTAAIDTQRNDLWIDLLRNRKAEYGVRLGPGGAIAELQHRLTGDRRLLAPAWRQENNDRIIQWTIWSDSLRLDRNWNSRLNVTQGGRSSGQFSRIVDVRVSEHEQRVRVAVTSNHDEQWLDRVGRRIKASFPSLTVYNVFNGVIAIDRYVLVHSLRKDGVRVRNADIYFEGWSPFSDAEFNRIVLEYDAYGNPSRFFTDEIDVPYYGDLPLQHTQGYVSLLNAMNPFAPKVHMIFGAKRGRGGARASLNLMDFPGGLAVLPSLQKDDVATGSLIHQHLRLMMTRDLGRSVIIRLENEASRVPASGIFAPHAIPSRFQDTARYLHEVHAKPGLRTDKLAIFLDEAF